MKGRRRSRQGSQQWWRLGIIRVGRSRHQVAPTAAGAPPHGACGGEGGKGAAGGAEAAGE
eukprot:3152822-Rhodomonas_salina.1